MLYSAVQHIIQVLFSLPSSDGTSGQVLQTNGSGVLSFSSVGGIGVGQTWQSVIGSRSGNTVYTNSTGKPIQVVVGTAVGNGQTYNGFKIDGVVRALNFNGGTTGITYTVFFIVPDGSTYESASALPISIWQELR